MMIITKRVVPQSYCWARALRAGAEDTAPSWSRWREVDRPGVNGRRFTAGEYKHFDMYALLTRENNGKTLKSFLFTWYLRWSPVQCYTVALCKDQSKWCNDVPAEGFNEAGTAQRGICLSFLIPPPPYLCSYICSEHEAKQFKHWCSYILNSILFTSILLN